ncbi:hypothetical protein [Pseudomonas corrugata]|uniref:hypothetical protein n=1 Tax=Pseudomonas corrugata TaxID=47879 RepID=UPI003877EF64
MIQRPTPGTFDLEFGVLAHSGQKSFAATASEILQHLKPSIGGGDDLKRLTAQAFQKARSPRLFSNALDLSARLARYGSIQIVPPTAVPARRITASGALRCTPGPVANPLNR